MHPERVWIALVILAVILLGSNLLMLGMVKGTRGFRMNISKYLGDATKPWKKEDEGLQELSQRVKELKEKSSKDDID
ncbi:MAG: hypothetical protein WCP19_07715 [Chloroflexota bacterium]